MPSSRILNRFRCALTPQRPEIIHKMVVTMFFSTLQSENHGFKVTEGYQVRKTTSIFHVLLSLPVLKQNFLPKLVFYKPTRPKWPAHTSRSVDLSLQCQHVKGPSSLSICGHFDRALIFFVCIRKRSDECDECG
jgi:hypothetical protein